MKLRELLMGCDYTPSPTLPPRGVGQGWGDMDISGVAYDSRKVKEGHLFVAIAGGKLDGHDFIKDAIKKGAVAIVHEHNNSEFRTQNSQSAICFIPVRESRKTLACIANNYYGMPSESLTLAGITGTNGKTTTTYILKSILESWGKDVGLIGTIQYMIKDRIYPALHTTPESLEFQKLLKDMSPVGPDNDAGDDIRGIKNTGNEEGFLHGLIGTLHHHPPDQKSAQRDGDKFVDAEDLHSCSHSGEFSDDVAHVC